MRACTIVPFHDDRWAANALGNVARLGLPSVFVVNGSARGEGLSGAERITSGSSHAAAFNAGVEWAKANGFDAAISCDSDDYYGPEYAQASLDALKIADVVGRRAVFTKLTDGIHLFEREGRSLLFGTVAFRLRDVAPALDVLDNCSAWVLAMAGRGARITTVGPEQYLYRRHGNNAHWRLPSEVFVRRAWGPSWFIGDLPDDVVNTAPTSRRFVEPPTDAEVSAALRGLA
jgi:hypothetical protein